MNAKEFEKKIEDLKSSDLDKVRDTIRELGYSGNKKAIPLLMNMLTKEKSTRLRNALALSLGDLQANETVPLLIKFIKDPENESKRGSFVYALQKLDCKEFFLDIVDLICTGDYEVYDHAHTIFESLVDDVTYNEKLLAKKKLKNQEQIELAMPPSKHPQFDRIHFVREALKLLD